MYCWVLQNLPLSYPGSDFVMQTYKGRSRIYEQDISEHEYQNINTVLKY